MQAFLENGKLTFRSDLGTLILKASGTVNTITGVDPRETSSILVPLTDTLTNYFVALSCPAGFGFAIGRNRFVNNKKYFATDAPVGTLFYYYIFQWSVVCPVSPTGVGYEFRDLAGAVTFTTTRRHARFKNLLGSADTDSAVSVTHTGRLLAAACLGYAGHTRYSDHYMEGMFWRYTQDTSGYGGRVHNGGQTVSNSVIPLVGGPDQGPTSDPPYGDRQKNGNIMVIDVTGIPLNQVFF